MDIDLATPLLGGLSPAQFMRRHWQKKPLLVRQAWPGVRPPVSRGELFDLAAQSGVESRLLTAGDDRWRLRHGPFTRRQLPSLKTPRWTLLVQGLDLHLDAARAMLDAFRFVPEARLDDLMISYASDGGGVGPHFDSYDVFLLQVHGRRRWRVAPPGERALVPDLPVKILQRFEPTEEWVLEPGDMLYLPPLWGHDGIAEGECMTCSAGFRAATVSELAPQLLQALAEGVEPADREPIYRDAAQPATAAPGRLPPSLRDFAAAALQRVLRDPQALDRALGAVISEPKPNVWFEPGEPVPEAGAALRLDRRSRMMYDERHVFLNGEAFVAAGRDARLMRRLADERRLDAAAWRQLSDEARALLQDWADAGWLRVDHALGS